MKPSDVDLLGSMEWHGEFFPPGKVEERFLGHLTYSASGGISLAYTILGHDVPSINGILHGVLSTGDPVTLFQREGGLDPGLGLTSGILSRSGTASFWGLCVGAHFDAEPSSDQYDFTLSGLDDFIVPNGATEHAVWSTKPIISAPMPDGVLQLINAGQGQLVINLDSVFISRNKNALDALNTKFGEVAALFPKSPFFVKKAMHYVLSLKYDEASPLQDALRRLLDISALFALLVRFPVHPRRIQFSVDPGTGTRVQVYVFLSEYLDEGTVRLALAKRSHHLMPITVNNAHLEQLVPVWLAEAVNHSVLVSSLQHRTGWRTRQATHGAVLLYATQIEGINVEEKGPKGQKYAYPVEKYASLQLVELLKARLRATTLAEVAKGISDIRNELAHVGRPPKHLKKLAGSALSDIALCLELIVVGYVLRKLGVATSVVMQYQDGFAPIAGHGQ